VSSVVVVVVILYNEQVFLGASALVVPGSPAVGPRLHPLDVFRREFLFFPSNCWRWRWLWRWQFGFRFGGFRFHLFNVVRFLGGILLRLGLGPVCLRFGFGFRCGFRLLLIGLRLDSDTTFLRCLGLLPLLLLRIDRDDLWRFRRLLPLDPVEKAALGSLAAGFVLVLVLLSLLALVPRGKFLGSAVGMLRSLPCLGEGAKVFCALHQARLWLGTLRFFCSRSHGYGLLLLGLLWMLGSFGCWVCLVGLLLGVGVGIGVDAGAMLSASKGRSNAGSLLGGASFAREKEFLEDGTVRLGVLGLPFLSLHAQIVAIDLGHCFGSSSSSSTRSSLGWVGFGMGFGSRVGFGFGFGGGIFQRVRVSLGSVAVSTAFGTGARIGGGGGGGVGGGSGREGSAEGSQAVQAVARIELEFEQMMQKGCGQYTTAGQGIPIPTAIAIAIDVVLGVGQIKARSFDIIRGEWGHCVFVP